MKKWIFFNLCITITALLSAQPHILINKNGDITHAQSYTSHDPALEYDSPDIHVYFSPDDNVREKLIEAINGENCSIKIAMFSLTDKKIAKALKKAFERGITIEIITDPTCLKDRFNKINFLSEKGIPVYVYNIAHSKIPKYSCMHHKFAIFDCNNKNKRFVWTGSFNFTKSASDSNQENVVIIHKRKTVDQFEEQFQKIKNRCSALIKRNVKSIILR